MNRLRCGLMVLSILMILSTSVAAEVRVGVSFPGISIGINLPLFPQMVLVPGYPVYYAPQIEGNYFFYDGMYWVYQDDNWYASFWYNGPWDFVEPEFVPVFILRIPVRYYRRPPVYFREWPPYAPPRWGVRWGHDWERRHSGWDRWQPSSAPSPAPLPGYQRHYSGDRYPGAEQQLRLHRESYRYQPRDTNVRQFYSSQGGRKAAAPASRARQEDGSNRILRQEDVTRSAPEQAGGAAGSRSKAMRRTSPQWHGSAVKNLNHPPGPGYRERQSPGLQRQERGPQERGGQGSRSRQGQNEEIKRGRGRNN